MCVCVAGGGVVLVILMFEFVPLEAFMYLVFTRMPGESYRRRLIVRFFSFCFTL